MDPVDPEDPCAGSPEGTWIDFTRENLGTLGLVISAIGKQITEAADDTSMPDVIAYSFSVSALATLRDCVDINSAQLLKGIAWILKDQDPTQEWDHTK